MAASSDSNVGPSTGFLTGYATVHDYQKAIMPHVVNAVKKASGLPEPGDSYDYYSSFTSFRELMHLESKRLLQLTQGILKHQNLRAGALGNIDDVFEIEDKFDALIEANDQLLERIGTFVDEAAGLRKKEADFVVAEVNLSPDVSGTLTASGTTASWNSSASARQRSGLDGDARKRTSSTFRLLASRAVARPQLKFRDKVDNSHAPFIPRLRHKPNAMQPWHDIIFNAEMLEESEITTIRHPYEYELEQLMYTDKQLTKCGMPPQLPLHIESSTPVQFIDNERQLMQLLLSLKGESEIAIDLEHHSYRTYQGITCLMQLSTRTQDYIIDALELRSELYILNEVFTDPKVVKVLHGADSDINWLQRDLGLYIVNMFDTHQASRALSHVRHSLGHLLSHYCGVNADKQYQLADWRIRPLPEELMRYAQEDTHYLLYIYDRLRDELIDKGLQAASGSTGGSANAATGLLRSVLEHSRRLCAKIYTKPVFRDDSYLELYGKSKKTFNSQQLQALSRLYSWRDETARAEDESPGYVLPNHMLLQIAEALPREREGVLACCSTVPPLVKMHLSSLHQIVIEARQLQVQKAEAVRVEAAVKKAAQKDSLLHCPHDSTPARDGQDRIEVAGERMNLGRVAVKPDASMSAFFTSPGSASKKPGTWDKLHTVLQSFVRLFDKYQPVKMIDLSAQGLIKKQILEAVMAPQAHAVKRKSSEIAESAASEAGTPNDSIADGSEPLNKDDTDPPPAKKAATVQMPTSNALIQPLRKVGGSAKKQKQGKEFVKPLDEEDFQAYDYSKTDLSIFSEKPKKAKRPDRPENAEHFIKPSTSRPRTQLGHNVKSVSFKQQPNSGRGPSSSRSHSSEGRGHSSGKGRGSGAAQRY